MLGRGGQLALIANSPERSRPMNGNRVLQINGFATLGSAFALLAARGVLPPVFGLSSPLLLDAVAAGFLAYGAGLLLAARRHPVSRDVLLFFTAADALYVLGSAAVLIGYWAAMAPLGRLLIIAVALVVEILATLQFRAAGGWTPRSARATA
jgi:hypothetical protein